MLSSKIYGRTAAMRLSALRMTDDQQHWAKAHAIIDEHGEKAFTFVSKQLVKAVCDEDDRAMDHWRSISDRISRLFQTARR